MLKNSLFVIIFLYSTIIQPFAFILLKPFGYILNIKFDWNLNSKLFIYYLCGVQQKIVNREKLIEKGFILANHRCFFDFAIDPYISNSSVVGRREAFYIVSFSYFLGVFDNKMIVFNRGRTKRHKLFKQITKHMILTNTKRIIFYPEGTRQNYNLLTSSNDIKDKLKYGLLKSIYENNTYPVQLCITSNKENVFNEKTLSVNYNTKIVTCYSKHIHPKNFVTFQSFIDKISEEWFECWKITHL